MEKRRCNPENLPMQDEHETSDMPGAVSNAR
jgi:hypothetical protein